MVWLLLIFLLRTDLCVQAQGHPAYLGLLPAHIPQHELAGIDLYMDTLVQFAIWCITIALGLPLYRLELWRNIFSMFFD